MKKELEIKKDQDIVKIKAIKSYMAKKKPVGINLSSEVIEYFKKMAEETRIPYQKLIDLYLLDCVKSRKKPSLKWGA